MSLLLLFTSPTGSSLLPETTVYIAAGVAAGGTEPDAARKTVINDLFSTLKTSGLWAKTEVLYLLAAHDSFLAGINAINPAVSAITVVPGVTFTTDRGYNGNGTSGYLNTNFAYATGVLFTQNSCHVGVWVRTITSSTGYDIGGSSSGRLRLNDSNEAWQVTASFEGTGLLSNTPGHFMGQRRDASNQLAFKDGVQVGTNAAASIATAGTMIVGSATVAVQRSDRQWAAAHAGAALSDPESLSLFNALSTYMVAVGAA